MTNLHAVTRDVKEWESNRLSSRDYLRHAVKKSGRKPFDISCEYARLQCGRGRLTLQEYVKFGLYKADHLSREEKSRFISNRLHWPVVKKCCDMSWQAATEDKWLCSHILSRSEIRVPETLAVIDKSERAYPGVYKISTPDGLRDFLMSKDNQPCFAKENRGICSFGAFLVLEADNDQLYLQGEGWLDYETCISQFVGDTTYIIQRVQKNHSFFQAYTTNLATVRVYVLLTEDGVKIPFACLKLPSGSNVTDSFWRPGNFVCDLVPETGEILRICSINGIEVFAHAEHPDTGSSIVGMLIPKWDELLLMVEKCALVFSEVKFQSMDVSISEDGPVLVEINTGGGFDLPQMASGKGFLTDEACEFFRSCGCRKL